MGPKGKRGQGQTKVSAGSTEKRSGAKSGKDCYGTGASLRIPGRAGSVQIEGCLVGEKGVGKIKVNRDGGSVGRGVEPKGIM